jgi:hypothetical protein
MPETFLLFKSIIRSAFFNSKAAAMERNTTDGGTSLGQYRKFYAATFGEVDQVGRRWGHCARRAGWGLGSHIHALGDGAEWVQLQTAEVFGTQGASCVTIFTSANIWPKRRPTAEQKHLCRF